MEGATALLSAREMTQLEWYAGLAMQGLLASPDFQGTGKELVRVALDYARDMTCEVDEFIRRKGQQ